MKKILHVIFSLNNGGAENLMVDIANSQSNYASVGIIVMNNIISEQVAGRIFPKIKFFTINRIPGSNNPFKLLHFFLDIKKFSPDIIHCHHPALIKLLNIFSFKKVLTLHDVNIRDRNIIKYNQVFSISNSVYLDQLSIGNETSIVHNGICFDQILSKKRIESKDIFNIVQISRLEHEKKGQHILIKAIGILVNEFSIKNIKCSFIGDGESKQFLLDLVCDLNINKNISFQGNQSRIDVYHNLCEYDLLVQPSIYEGFGLTVVEGMAAKIPVIVSDVEGPMEVINNGEYGHFFEMNNARDLAQKIKILLDMDINMKRDMVEKSYSYAKSHFSIDQTALNYYQAYEF